MKIMKGCLLSVSSGILGILVFGGIVLLLTNETRIAAIAALLAGTVAPLVTAVVIWAFDHRYWTDAVEELRNRLGRP